MGPHVPSLVLTNLAVVRLWGCPLSCDTHLFDSSILETTGFGGSCLLDWGLSGVSSRALR